MQGAAVQKSDEYALGVDSAKTFTARVYKSAHIATRSVRPLPPPEPATNARIFDTTLTPPGAQHPATLSKA